MAIFVNNIIVEGFNFPAGECQVRLNNHHLSNEASLLAELFDSNDIMTLLLAIDALRRINPRIEIDLCIPYFPYARQDRVCNKGEALSVKVMADLINGLNCRTVIIVDPHSDVTSALINRCVVKTPADLIIHSRLMTHMVEKNMTLVSPDAGSEKRVRHLARQMAAAGHPTHVVIASKKRDPSTGLISDHQVFGDVTGKTLIIIDDICDGGQTFISLAQSLKKQGAAEIFLYVTHGIFSKGLDELKTYIQHIYCYHLVGHHLDSHHPSFITILKGEAS